MACQNDHLTVPDGGWGWIVVISSFYFQALTIGITYTFGIKLVALKETFPVSESIIAWIGSIQPCLLYLTGLFYVISNVKICKCIIFNFRILFAS